MYLEKKKSLIKAVIVFLMGTFSTIITLSLLFTQISDVNYKDNNADEIALYEAVNEENAFINVEYDREEYNIKKDNYNSSSLNNEGYANESGNIIINNNQENTSILQENKSIPVSVVMGEKYSLEKLSVFDYMIKNLYIVDASTRAVKSEFDIMKFVSMDFTIAQNKKKAQILIYHTHASETYIDSRKNNQDDTVVGMGEYLSELLQKGGYKVIHDKTAYDRKDGKDNRNYAYSTARPAIEKILEENPSIEVIIDLHRDSGERSVSIVNNKECAKIMLFNGLSRDSNGPIDYLENKNQKANLAFSLQTKLYGDYLYPGLFKKIYLKNYRYNMHLKEKYLLIELGTQKNTVKDAYNAIEPLSKVLLSVLQQ